MPDMIVPLYKLPALAPVLETQKEQGIIIRRANTWELSSVREFIIEHFSAGWADEATACFSQQPVSLFIAVREGKILGFGAYETTRRGFFGPTGVAESERKKGIGAALLVASMQGLLERGYGYAIIGGVGPIDFYEKIVGAILIPDSTPGVYRDLLKRP